LRWIFLYQSRANNNSDNPQIKLKRKTSWSRGLTKARRLSLVWDWCGTTRRLSVEHSIIYTHVHTCSWYTEKPEGYMVLNLYWAALRSHTHYNKAAIFKSSHKIVVIFAQDWCCPGRPHSCFLSVAELDHVTDIGFTLIPQICISAPFSSWNWSYVFSFSFFLILSSHSVPFTTQILTWRNRTRWWKFNWLLEQSS